MDMSNECCLMRQNWPTQKSVDSLSLGFIGIVIVSPPVMFSIIEELVAWH